MIQSSRCDGSGLHPSTQYSPLLGCMSANIFSQSVWCFFTLFPWVCRNFSALYNPIPLSSMVFFFSSVVLQYWILYLSLYFLPDFYIWCMMRVKFHSSACIYSQHLLVKTLTFSPLHVLGPLVEKSVHCKCGGCFWSLGAVLMDDVSTSAPALCLFSR